MALVKPGYHLPHCPNFRAPRLSGARQLIGQAVEAELQELLATHADLLVTDGRVGMVRDGYRPEREIQAGLGPITVRIPKV